MVRGHHGIDTISPRPDYKTYISKFGPSTKPAPNFHGIDAKQLMRFGYTGALFGVSAGIFAVFFFSGIPKVRTDILEKLPIIGDTFKKEVPASDNPF